jgi:hypothetical protein
MPPKDGVASQHAQPQFVFFTLYILGQQTDSDENYIEQKFSPLVVLPRWIAGLMR